MWGGDTLQVLSLIPLSRLHWKSFDGRKSWKLKAFMVSGVTLLNDDDFDDDDGGIQKEQRVGAVFLFFLKGIKWVCSHVAKCL